MVLPAFATAGSALTGSSSTAADVPVPSGVVIDSVVFVLLYVETTQTVTAPSGFTECAQSPVVVTGTNAHNLHVYWKRATAADSGTYGFTIASGLGWRSGIALRFTGCCRVGTPFEAATSAIRTTSTAATSPAVSATSLGPDREFLWVASSFANNATSTPPSGVTERVDVASGNGLTAGTKDQASAASSGSLSGTFSANGASGAWLAALIPEAPGQFFTMF